MKLENKLDYINDSLITKRIIGKYKNHTSIKAIQDTFPLKKEFKIEEAKVEQIKKILRNINSRKAARPDKIPPKILKMSANIIVSHLTNIINSDLKRNSFSDSVKVASIRPIFKGKGDRTEIKITGQLLFNIFLKDLFLCLKKQARITLQKIILLQRSVIS